ncbi:MAG: hypothetical protein GEU90_06565, partial [Gemmatimonas sp.]|nr:hypothetical protein [Gemmatimonas sp.]
LVDCGASADIFLAAALGLTDRVLGMVQADPGLLGLRTGRGKYAEQPPSSYHIYFWTIGDGRSPLEVAAQFDQRETSEVMSKLASPLQRFLSACRLGDEAEARSALRKHPGLMESMRPDDHRAIADAAWNGNGRAVALMVELGFDPRTPGHDSGTALHCAAWEGSISTVGALLRHPEARSLLSIRDVNYGSTPLGWCCHGSRFGNASRDHAAVAKLLLEAGARPGADTAEASPAVEAALASWRRSQ